MNHPSVHRALELLRRAFESQIGYDSSFTSGIIIASEDYRDRLSRPMYAAPLGDQRVRFGQSAILRHPSLRPIGPEDQDRIADEQFANAVFRDDRGVPVAIRVPGTLARLEYQGEKTTRGYFRYADDAGQCLRHMAESIAPSLSLPELIDVNVLMSAGLQSNKLSSVWTLFLHILGWQPPPESLIRAQRVVWEGNESFQGDPQSLAELHQFDADFVATSSLRHIPLPPPFFSSVLEQDPYLASVYAIDVLLSDELSRDLPDYDQLARDLRAIKPGKAEADRYHRHIEKVLNALFYPALRTAEREVRVDQGRKRIDVLCENRAERGFFHEIVVKHGVRCPYIFFECKNYANELSNKEFDQAAGRLSDERGNLVFIVCRKCKDRAGALARARDRFVTRKKELVLVLDDNDLLQMLQHSKADENRQIDDLLASKLRAILLNQGIW